MRLVHFLEYILVRALLAFFQGFPYAAALKLGSLLGRAAYVVARVARARARDNVRLAFGDRLDARAADLIVRGAFDTMGRHAVEVAHVVRRGVRGFVLENPEILENAHRLGRGIILVSAHMGCFARLVLVPRLLGIGASAIMKKQSNRRLHQWIAGLMERHFKVSVLLKTDAVDHIAGELRRGRMVGFFADQRPRHGGFLASFFGRPVRVASGPAVYARRCGAPIVVLTLLSRPDGTHVARCEGPIGEEGTLEEVSARWMAVIESRIREHPGQWMWMHRRWR